MHMKYGIQPIKVINATYAWNFSDVEQAKEAARKLTAEFYVDVLVFEIIGTFSSVVEFLPQS